MALDTTDNNFGGPFEPNPEKLWVNGCIQYSPSIIAVNDGEKGININLDQIIEPGQPLGYNFMTTVSKHYAKQLLKASSMKYKGVYFKASRSLT